MRKSDETDRLTNYKCVTRLHSNLNYNVCFAEEKPTKGEGEKKMFFFELLLV